MIQLPVGKTNFHALVRAVMRGPYSENTVVVQYGLFPVQQRPQENPAPANDPNSAISNRVGPRLISSTSGSRIPRDRQNQRYPCH